MMFGDHVSPADTVAPTEWIEQSCRGEWWTVGALVPNQYESLLRVFAPVPGHDGWWSAYRELFEVVVSIGEHHTSSPDRGWFAIWEGHGFDNAGTRVAWRDPPVDEEERRARDAERAQLRDEDQRRNAAIRAELNRFPRFDRPGRTYYLLQGPLRAVSQLRYPDSRDWRNPDLFWPDDRRWFVATDVDFWSIYVGGRSSFIAELADAVPTRSEPVELDLPLEIED